MFPDPSPEVWIEGYPVWRATAGQVEVRFVGRGPELSREATLARIEPTAPPVAALEQVHSAVVVEAAAAGFHGQGDAMQVARPELAASVVTADCVPLLAAVGERVLAVHAGWRGIAARILDAAFAPLALASRRKARVWIGPAIGPCCYEVDEDVAAKVLAASSPAVASAGPGGKPHLDLRRAAADQLAALGVGPPTLVGPCTRCHPDLLWSYRRDGKLAGRNLAFVWRRSAPAG